MNIKSLLAVAAVSAFSTPVFAGPYVGLDTKSIFSGSDYTSSEFTGKIGWQGTIGTSNYFIEGGTFTTAADNGDTDTNLRVATGIAFAVTEKVGVNIGGELKTVDNGDNNYEVVSGVKYSF